MTRHPNVTQKTEVPIQCKLHNYNRNNSSYHNSFFVLLSFYIYCSGAQLFQWKINKNPRPSGRGTSQWIGLESLFRIWHIIFRKSFLYSLDFVEERLEPDNKTLKILQYLIR